MGQSHWSCPDCHQCCHSCFGYLRWFSCYHPQLHLHCLGVCDSHCQDISCSPDSRFEDVDKYSIWLYIREPCRNFSLGTTCPSVQEREVVIRETFLTNKTEPLIIRALLRSVAFGQPVITIAHRALWVVDHTWIWAGTICSGLCIHSGHKHRCPGGSGVKLSPWLSWIIITLRLWVTGRK